MTFLSPLVHLLVRLLSSVDDIDDNLILKDWCRVSSFSCHFLFFFMMFITRAFLLSLSGCITSFPSLLCFFRRNYCLFNRISSFPSVLIFLSYFLTFETLRQKDKRREEVQDRKCITFHSWTFSCLFYPEGSLFCSRVLCVFAIKTQSQLKSQANTHFQVLPFLLLLPFSWRWWWDAHRK